ncbi:uncharacterized protein LOC105828989 [Monomorium pharaonis]|uniref:uncharacterized protein LOC105828989 n=1 Tax=Monomorium pharaonis TaxID=307658 RepID=UPI001746FC7D|nr:uncharacterized protein LOC105828989 [Monomorium pharaonis]
MLFMITTFGSALYAKDEYHCNIVVAIYFMFLRDYSFHINFIGDLITASILEYIILKFNQINEHLQHLMKNNIHKIERVWENPIMRPYQQRFSNALSKKCIMWIVIHLHLELRKISHEIDLIFGTQMTFKMACYFNWIVIDLRRIMYTVLIQNYARSKIIVIIIHIIWFFHNVFKFILINYMCETLNTKASATADSLHRLLNYNCDVEIREIILQFALRITYAPLRFYGIGLFQFGYKFLHKFVMSIATVLVILIQAHTNK